jgi:hypothetical protein
MEGKRAARLNAAYNILKTIARERDGVESQLKLARQQTVECMERLNRARALLKTIKDRDFVSIGEYAGAKKLIITIMIELHSLWDSENVLHLTKETIDSKQRVAIREYENASKKSEEPEGPTAIIYCFPSGFTPV